VRGCKPSALDAALTGGEPVILQTVRFFAVILTALALVPAGAHFFERPNKIRLSQEQYFTIQGIYRGWALFGFVLLGAIGTNLVHTILVRDEPRAFWLALLAFLLMVASFAIFFIIPQTRRRLIGQSPQRTGRA
jgi:hypothetical protein